MTQIFLDTQKALQNIKSFDEFQILQNDFHKLFLSYNKRKFVLTSCKTCKQSILLLSKLSYYLKTQFFYCSYKCNKFYSKANEKIEFNCIVCNKKNIRRKQKLIHFICRTKMCFRYAFTHGLIITPASHEVDCASCNKVFYVDKKDLKIQTYFFCSSKCANKERKKGGLIQLNFEKSCEEKYGDGIINPFQDKIVREKIKKTNLEKYGVEFGSQSEQARNKQKEHNKNRTKEEWKEIDNKTKQTNLERYGKEYYTQTEGYKQKTKEAWENKSGEEIEEINKNREETNLEKYNSKVGWHSKDEFGNLKREQTCLEKYNVRHPMQNPDIQEKCQVNSQTRFKKGYFYSIKNQAKIHFDSSYELQALKILELDNEIISFERCKTGINYIWKDKQRKYFPDFIAMYVDNSYKIIEIKPENLLKQEKIQAKLLAASIFYQSQNIIFELWTEAQLNL